MKKRKILFVHYNDLYGNSGGSKVTFEDYYGCMNYGKCDTYKTGKVLFEDEPSMMFMSFSECQKIIEIINRYGYDIVFFDTSLYGDAIGYIKENCPSIKTVVRSHNYERIYYEDQERLCGGEKLSIRAAKCESAALFKSDFRIFMSREDKEALCEDYDISIKNNLVVPVTLKDEYFPLDVIPKNPYVLFFGSKFFSNVEAAHFLAKQIAPKINKKILIVGRGMETVLDKEYKNVEVKGFVPSLKELCIGADAFISPTFSGSGSKVKIAEALMYGKYIIASKSSLAGYDTNNMDVSICEKAEEFIDAINATGASTRFSSNNRNLFLKDHNLSSQVSLFSFLKDL